ncbi:Two-component response regulator ARR1 [Linum perenne]
MEKTTPVPNVDDDRLPTTKNKSTPADEYTDDSLPSDFPVGLKVLLIDDNPTCLLILRQMLHRCMFRVTACRKSKDAVAMLREDKFRFDIVISDVHMPEIDGFKILEVAAQEMDLPVVCKDLSFIHFSVGRVVKRAGYAGSLIFHIMGPLEHNW